MIQQSEKKASPCKMSLKAEKEQDMQRKLETNFFYKYELDEPTVEELEATDTEEMPEDDPTVLKPPFPNESDDSSAHSPRHRRFSGSRHTTAGRTRGGRICCYQTHGSYLRPPLLSSLTGRASTEDLMCITSSRADLDRPDWMVNTTHGLTESRVRQKP